MNAIEIRNLTFSYDGKRKILDGLNLDIKRGDFVGIVGDSGCGKSTLCHILLRHNPQCHRRSHGGVTPMTDSGSVIWNSKRWRRESVS